jgi:hypothetical protein
MKRVLFVGETPDSVDFSLARTRLKSGISGSSRHVRLSFSHPERK